MFTPEECRELYARIRAIRLGCTFLVFGFDKHGKAHLFELPEATSGEGSDKVMDEVGFWAIGSGQYSALSVLFFHQYSITATVPLALYRVCEAKFMAESGQGVGKASMAASFRPDLNASFFGQAKIAKIKEQWKLQGAPRTPENTEQLVQSMLDWTPLVAWE